MASFISVEVSARKCDWLNPLPPTVAIWVQLVWSILCQTGLNRHLQFLTSGHSDAQSWASECPDVKNYKWRLNPVWHRMLYSCTHMATVGVRGLSVDKTERIKVGRHTEDRRKWILRIGVCILNRCRVRVIALGIPVDIMDRLRSRETTRHRCLSKLNHYRLFYLSGFHHPRCQSLFSHSPSSVCHSAFCRRPRLA